MAPPIRISSIFFFCSVLGIVIALSEASDKGALTLRSDDQVVNDVHDLLTKYGFPKGLLPDNVKSFNVSNKGLLQVRLRKSCNVSTLGILYGVKIGARLAYGSLTRVYGIRGKTEHGFSLTVVSIKLNQTSNTIAFSIGGRDKDFPVTDFDVAPSCEAKLLDLEAIM